MEVLGGAVPARTADGVTGSYQTPSICQGVVQDDSLEISLLNSKMSVDGGELDATNLCDRLCPVHVSKQERKQVTIVEVTPEPPSSISSSGSLSASKSASVSASVSSSALGQQEGGKEDEEGCNDVPLIPLPVVPADSLRREFVLPREIVDVTSMDITPHGCYVLVGCGNGSVFLFDLTQPIQEPCLVGQIVAKGLHTNLLMTVKISEDCRFCFAGVSKGSSELLAIDLGRLPGWPNGSTSSTVRRRHDFVYNLVSCHRNSDPKLRGFGDAVRLRGSCSSVKASSSAVYRLACGRGIKNVHIWQFVCPSSSRGDAPKWTCIYDVASNGNTIETVVFRNGGTELLSKSAGVCLRVWDLHSFDKDPSSRPSFEDIQNTADVRSLQDGFAFGGTYKFAIVKLAAPKAANRDELEVPERPLSLKASGRRMLREIDDVMATADARHALILCTDGGVIYFNRANEEVPGGGMVELSGVQRDPDCNTGTGRGWALRRVGHRGEVLLLRTTQTSPVSIMVGPLSDHSEEVQPTAVQDVWTEWGFFCDKSAPLIDESMLLPADRALFPLVTPAQKNGAQSSGMVRASSTGSLLSSQSAPASAPRTGSGRPPLVPVAGGSEKSTVKRVRKVSAPRVTPSSQPFEFPTSSQQQKHSIATPVQELQYRQQQQQQQQHQQMQMQQDYYEQEEDREPVKRRALVLSQPPKVRRVVEVPLKPARTKPRLSSIVYERFTSLCSNWIESNKRGQGRADAVLAREDRALQPLGVNTLRQLGAICAAQDRLRSQFVGDVARTIARHLQSSLNDDGGAATGLAAAEDQVDIIVKRYEAAAAELVLRQQLDLTGVLAMDSLLAFDGSQKRGLKIVFRHVEMWNSAREFLRTTRLLLDAALTTQYVPGERG